MKNPNPNNLDQVDDSEFKRHIKNLTGREPKSSFVLKEKIYRETDPINNGFAFDVYEGRLASGATVAIKVYRETISTNGEGIKFVQRMMRHVEFWTSFQHSSILLCHGINMQIRKGPNGKDKIKL